MNNWESIRISDVCEFKYGKALKSADRNGGDYPVYGSSGIVGFHSEYLTQKPTIIIGRKGSVGEIYYTEKPCWPIDTAYYLEYDSNKVHIKWVVYLLKRLNLKKLDQSAAIPGLNRNDVYKIKIKLPPLRDQIRIAIVLSKAEALIAKRKESLLLSDKLVTDTFMELFGDFLKNEDNYVLITDVADFIDYRGKTPLRVERGIPLISAKCVRRGYFDEQRLDYIEPETYKEIMTRGFPEAGDVLFTTEGATMGFTCRIPLHFKEFAVGQRLITLKCKKGNSPTALECILNHPFIQGKIMKKATGSAAIGIRSAEFAKIRIPKPPFELQTQFAQIVEKVEALKAHYQDSLKELENLYGSLSQRAFKGEL